MPRLAKGQICGECFPVNRKTVEIHVIAETQFGNAASLKSLKAGDRVKVDYRREGDHNVAISIDKVILNEIPENSGRI